MMKKFFEGLVKPFLPKYQVVFRMYHVIPGQEVERNEQKFDFEKGAGEEAQTYFQKVVEKTESMRMVPAEVLLKKRGRVISRRTFGPIDDVTTHLNVKAS
jgi:hypothetical protein